MAQRVRPSIDCLRFISGVGAVLAASSVGMFASEARACSGTSVGSDFGVRAQIPENGQVVGTYTCLVGTTCSFPQTLDVLSSAGEPVAGELTVSEHPDRTSAVYTFRPAQPWSLGETYSVTDLATAPLASEASTFTVVPAVTLEAGRISAETELGEVRTTLNEVCCDGRYYIDSCGGRLCTPLETLIELGIYVHATVPAEQLGQWLSRLHAVDVGGEDTRTAVAAVVSPWGFPSLHVVEQRQSYCVQVEFLSLVDGTTVLREPQCVSHGSLPDLGRVTNDPLLSAQDISLCDAPPPGIEEAWCAGMVERCESGWPQDACARHDEFCADVSVESAGENVSAVDSGCTVAQGAPPPHTVYRMLLPLAAAMVAGGWRRASAGRRRRH